MLLPQHLIVIIKNVRHHCKEACVERLLYVKKIYKCFFQIVSSTAGGQHILRIQEPRVTRKKNIMKDFTTAMN